MPPPSAEADWPLPSAGADLPLPSGHTSTFLVLSGEVTVNGGQPAKEGDLVIFERAGDGITVAARTEAKLLVMVSDGSPTECTVAALQALVRRLTGRMGMLCAQVAVRPLDDVCFPHFVLLEDEADECVRKFGQVMLRLVRKALRG